MYFRFPLCSHRKTEVFFFQSHTKLKINIRKSVEKQEEIEHLISSHLPHLPFFLRFYFLWTQKSEIDLNADFKKAKDLVKCTSSHFKNTFSPRSFNKK